MSIYFVPALVALTFKLLVLSYVLRGSRVSTVFLSLIIIFSVHNTIELFGYLSIQNDDAINVFFRLYYVATILVLLYIMLHGLTVSKLENMIATGLLISISSSLSGLILFTDLVIAGQYSIGYSVTAVKGTLYWLFAIYSLTLLLGSLAITLYGYRSAKTQIDSVRIMHSLMALAPVILVSLLVIIFKITNIEINAIGLAPIATSLFLIIVMKTESKHKLSDLKRFIPLSPERKTTNNLMDLLDVYIQQGDRVNAYKKLQEGIEKEVIQYSIKKCDGNVTDAAKMMGLKHRSTLYSMMSRLEIDLKKLQTTD